MVLPEPVSPQIITTWFSLIAVAISAFLALTGSSNGYSGLGKLLNLASYLAVETLSFCVISASNRCALTKDFSSVNFLSSFASRNLRRSIKRSASMHVCRLASKLAKFNTLGFRFKDLSSFIDRHFNRHSVGALEKKASPLHWRHLIITD